jgi:hypothetical protein
MVNEALFSTEHSGNLIRAEESKVGYINGIVSARVTENYKETKFNTVTNISCMANPDYNNQHIIVPIDQNLQSIVHSLSRSTTLLLNNLQISPKNMVINIKEPNLTSEENRSLASLLTVAWISAVTNKKIRSQSTIIADVLPNNDLEFDSKTINKIQMAYNNNIRYIVIAKSKSFITDEGSSPYSQEFENVMRVFNLKLKKKTDNMEIYYHDYQNIKEDSIYPGLEICVVDHMKDAIEYLLINN